MTLPSFQVCQCCQSTHFTLVNRRHHCRKCGRVVCGGCSSRTFVLSNISDKPQRVCNTCYNRLCNGLTTPAAREQPVEGGEEVKRMVTLGGAPLPLEGAGGAESSDSDGEEGGEELERGSVDSEEYEAVSNLTRVVWGYKLRWLMMVQPKFYPASTSQGRTNGQSSSRLELEDDAKGERAV